jgi:hypothetical protein
MKAILRKMKKKTCDGKLLAVKNFGFSFYQKAFFFSNKKFQVIDLLVKTIKVSWLFPVFPEKASQTEINGLFRTNKKTFLRAALVWFSQKYITGIKITTYHTQ